jgi:hypothetical protein
MTKLTLVSATLIAVATFTTQTALARSDAHHAMASAKAGVAGDCVRAPNVGAFASAPYAAPPCLPNGAN